MRSIAALFTLLAAVPCVGAQGASVSGRVVARETGEPLGYAIVGLEGLDRAQFANDSGRFYFADLTSVLVRLRVRRLGYQPFDTSVVLERDAPTVVRIELTRVAVRLSEVIVRSHPPCRKPGRPPPRDTALAAVFTQLRMNAEQYDFLTERFPLNYLLQIEMSRRLRADGSVVRDTSLLRRVDARPAWRYRPGRLVVRQGKGWFVHLPILRDFADEAFIRNHCFHYGGVALVDGHALIRVDVVAAQSLRSPDVSGSIYLDPESFQIRRSVLQLTTPRGRFGNVLDLEITTEFREILQSIPIIASVRSVQRIDPAARSVDFDEAYENQELRAYEFLEGRPGDPRPGHVPNPPERVS